MHRPRPKASLRPQLTIPRGYPPGNRYLAGISGGRDSVALLKCLVDQGYKDLIVCHLNHQLRGGASEADARFVRKLAESYDLPVEIGSAPVRALAAKRKMSIEAAGREARYSFFAKVAKRTGRQTIFLGHHADDLVETFLINLFRGAGSAGLVGMRETSKRFVDHVDLTVVRPFLGVWRKDIDQYVRAHRLKFREDASNRDLIPLRNRIRHRVIPYLEKTLGRNIRQNIWRTATITAEEENFFEALIPEKLLHVAALAVQPLRDMLPAVQRRMVQKWLQAAKIPDIGFDLIERVRDLVDEASCAAKTNLPGNRHVRRRAGKLFLE